MNSFGIRRLTIQMVVLMKVKLRLSSKIFFGALYCSRTYPYTSTYRPTLFNTDIVEATAYSEGWIYMYPTTYDAAEWPDH